MSAFKLCYKKNQTKNRIFLSLCWNAKWAGIHNLYVNNMLTTKIYTFPYIPWVHVYFYSSHFCKVLLCLNILQASALNFLFLINAKFIRIANLSCNCSDAPKLKYGFLISLPSHTEVFRKCVKSHKNNFVVAIIKYYHWTSKLT